MTIESGSFEEPHANTELPPRLEPSVPVQELGAKVLGYFAAKKSLEKPLSDEGLMKYIASDTRLSDAMAEGAIAGAEDREKR